MKVHRLVDDLDGSVDDVETRHFGLDGRYYEIDLSKENWDLLLAELEPFIRKGHDVTNKKVLARPTPPRKSFVRVRSVQENHEIRAWARQNGWPKLNARGRVPQSVLDAFAARDVQLPESA